MRGPCATRLHILKLQQTLVPQSEFVRVLETSSVCRQQFANMFLTADVAFTHANLSLTTQVCQLEFVVCGRFSNVLLILHVFLQSEYLEYPTCPPVTKTKKR